MPYELGTIWNVTSKYIYNTLDKNIGIGTTTPICELDVYCNIAENGIKLEDKYQLKPENNKKYDLIVREDLNQDYLDPNYSNLIIWYKFNKDDFTSNYAAGSNGLLSNESGTISNLQKEYYVGTGSAEINDELYYKIHMSSDQFTAQKCTFCFWLFLNEECISNRFILNLKDTGADPISDIFYFKYATDELTIYKNSYHYIEYNHRLAKNKWHHITIIIDDTSVQKQRTLLIDGISINSNLTGTITTVLRGGNSGTADIYLGYTTGSSIDGYIDDFRIYQSNLQIDYIQNNIIGKITKITPGNIGANGNYGIDIVNYSNIVNIGSTNSNVDLKIFGDLKVTGDLSISNLDIVTAEFITLNVTSNLTVGSNVDIDNYLTVSKTITENQRTLAQKYASISQIDKHTDVIISKMTDKEDVRTLYSTMPEFFQSNLILAYDFDFNIHNIDNPDDFFSNNVLQLNSNTALIYSTFSQYSIVPNIPKDTNAIDYYGTKYVKGNSSLHCGSNIFNSGGIDYYSFNTQGTTNNATFSYTKSYTIAFWIRFNEIDRTQHIFRFGVPINPVVDTIEKSINISLNSSNNLNIKITDGIIPYNSNIDELEFKKDEWYHIVLILKNARAIDTIPKNIYTNSNLLIQYFEELEYTDNTTSASNRFTFNTPANMATIFTYVNGIYLKKLSYLQNITIFGNELNCSNYFGVLDSSTTTDYLNGYIDDFKMYQTVVPINYINENIIGDALIIKPGLLSAIGNYGINIKNFTNIVSVGNSNNDVDLHIYGLLKIEETKLTISNCDIDVIDDTLTTSNFAILETLDVSNITVSNIEIYDLISGPDFHLGSSNFISNIKIDHLSNINLNSCNITADTITVNNELILGDAILSNINIVGINIDDTFSISNNDIKIRSNLIIGDNSSNVRRYDLGSVDIPSGVLATSSNFYLYNAAYPHPSQYTLTTITDIYKGDIQIFDKSIIFYGHTNENRYDIHFKNNYIRNENCNIETEINKSYVSGADRNRTRIKLDVGNISLQNGFIELIQKDILTKDEPSKLKIEENQISITSNVNTTILNDSLMLSNANNYCVLTTSNFLFNNEYGFTDNETLHIKTISIVEAIEIVKIKTTNTSSNIISIDTSNASIIGKIRGHLCSNSIIDITDEIKTTSNITASNITASNITITDTLYTSNIICDYEITFKDDGTTNCNTIIRQDSIDVHQLHIYGGITLGQQTGSADNSIEGSFGSLNIRTIKTTNSNSAEISIDTFHLDKLGKIRGFLYSNSEINITGLIETSSNIIGIDITASNLYASNIQGIPGDDLCSIIGRLESNSVINISGLIETSSNIIASNITITDTLDVSNITVSNILISDSVFGTYLTASNILYASNIQGIPGDDLCSIIGRLESNSVINISGLIETSSNIIASNITITDTLDVSNITVSNILISDSVFGTYLTASNILYASNIRGIDGDDLCSIIGRLESDSVININCNITTTQDIHSLNQFTSNTLFVSNIQGIPGDDLCSIIGRLESNSIINISGEIETSSNIIASNITINDTLYASNIRVSNILISDSVFGTYLTASNILYASNIQGIPGDDLCSIIGRLENDSIIDINCNITTTQDIHSLNQFTSNTLFVSNIQGIDGDDLCSIIGKLESNSIINISGEIETSSNIIASNITINDTLYASNIRVSNISITDSVFGTDLTASNILYASNIRGIDGVPCSIIGRLENDSIININCNITTTQDIHSLNQFTSNTLFVSNIQGIPGDDLCSIIGKLESNSIINISGEIKTSSNIIANNITINDTLDVSNITDSSTNDYFITSSNSGIFVNKIRTNNTIDGVYSIDTLVGNTYGKIRAKLADNSEIDITCNITTTANIKADILFINTITTNSSEINITPTLKCDSIELNTINSDFEILRALNVLNDRANRSGTYTGVELLNDHIKWYDETAESYIKINNTGLFSKAGKNKDVEYEIISYNDANDIKIKCDILEVASFDVGDGSKFSFPNIIDYSKSTATNTETNETYNIPNVYIGDDKTFANINETLDVLYVDTPYTTRLNTGNLLVRDILEISPDSSKSSAINSMKIFTGNINTHSGSREADIITSPFTNFTNQNGDTIISCSLDTNSVGINTQPGITDDDIKLYIEGGIQCSKDIVAFANVSDKRFKTNITSFDINDIDIVNKLNPVRFIWKDNLFNSNMANKPDIGFIAQEVKEVIPEAVSVCKIEMNNIDYNYIKYERIIPYLVNNIKYLNNKIVELENKLNGV